MTSRQRKKNIVVRNRLTINLQYRDDDVFSDFCEIFRIPRRFMVSLKRRELCMSMANQQSGRKKIFISYVSLPRGGELFQLTNTGQCGS